MRRRTIPWPCSASRIGQAISVYAQNRDYHDVMKGRLKQLAGWLAATHRRGGQGVRRHRTLAGEAAGRAGRRRLAGQAHQPGLAPAGLLVLPGRDPDHRRCCRRTSPRPTIAAAAGAASMSARRTPSRPRTSSMPGAASRTSPSSTRGRSRASSARPWAIGSMAATIAWPSAPGTGSRSRRARPSCRRGTTCGRRRLPSSCSWTMRRSGGISAARRSSGSAATGSSATS